MALNIEWLELQRWIRHQVVHTWYSQSSLNPPTNRLNNEQKENFHLLIWLDLRSHQRLEPIKKVLLKEEPSIRVWVPLVTLLQHCHKVRITFLTETTPWLYWWRTLSEVQRRPSCLWTFRHLITTRVSRKTQWTTQQESKRSRIRSWRTCSQSMQKKSIKLLLINLYLSIVSKNYS